MAMGELTDGGVGERLDVAAILRGIEPEAKAETEVEAAVKPYLAEIGSAVKRQCTWRQIAQGFDRAGIVYSHAVTAEGRINALRMLYNRLTKRAPKRKGRSARNGVPGGARNGVVTSGQNSVRNGVATGDADGGATVLQKGVLTSTLTEGANMVRAEPLVRQPLPRHAGDRFDEKPLL